MDRPRVNPLTGLLVGLLTSVPLAALFFLFSQLVGSPLVPFDLFDWLARVLPGGVITRGIEAMVSTLVRLGLSVRETAKTAEGSMGVAIFLALGMAAAAVFFALMNGLPPAGSSRRTLPGLLLGLAVGIPMLIIVGSVTEGGLGLIGAVWVLGGFLGWGAFIGWAYDRLTAAPPAGPPAVPTPVAADALTVEQIGRRQFLIRMGGAAAAVTVVGAGVGLLLPGRRSGAAEAPAAAPQPASGEAINPNPAGPDPVNPEDLPNADAAVQPAPGTRPEYTPLADHYRIDINLRPPEIDGTTWTLPITGLVERPLSLTLTDLRANYLPVSQFVTLACISNGVGGDLIGTTLWTGIPMQTLLADVGVRPEARYLKITSIDGFWEIVSLDLINADERIMLCYEWDGQPLEVRHGYPARIYIPDRYGMKQPKWITGMELTDTYEEGYWVVRGWDELARMNTTSVIDTVAADDAYEQDGALLVPVGGIAHAGARGIIKVEVSIDGGPWQEAQLRDPISETTWVIWRYDWPFAEGEHTFTVRATDGEGALQTDRLAPPHPSGATGYHRYDVSL